MLIQIESLPLIQAPLLQAEEWLIHGFGLKDIPAERYLKILGSPKAFIPETKQTHGRDVHIIPGPPSPVPSPWSVVRGPLQGDAFLTDQPGIVCHVRTADCVPLLLADCKNRVIGAVHTGWRGTAEKVIQVAIERMQKEWQTDPADLKAALGPAIGGHCYEVGGDVAGAFEKAGLHPGEWMEEIWNDRWYLDLAFVNFHLLQAAGVPKEKIYLSLACTACDLEKFASYRKEGKGTGRQISFILIR